MRRDMDVVKVERLGGLAGYGNSRARIRSRGEIALESLPAEERDSILELFRHPPKGAPLPDAFRYRLSHVSGGRTQTVEVSEELVPDSVRQCVRDELL